MASFQRGPLRIRSQPGSRLSYSNMGYTLLGLVIERVTGERYEQYLDDHFLGPLGMHQSTFRFVSQEGPRARSEEHTSELQSLMRTSYAVFCLKKKNQNKK